MISGARVIRAAAVVELRYLAVNRFMLFCVTVQPFFIALTTIFMLRRSASFDPTYVVVGAALTGLWSLILFNGNWAISSERWQGTLETIVGSPTDVELVVAGKLLGTLVLSSFSMLTCYLVAAWLFGYEIHIADPGAFCVSLLLTLLGLWATGLLIAPLGILWRWAGLVLNVLEYPVYTLSGFLFPVLLLPGWMLPASWLLPPFWGATALHLTSASGWQTVTPALWAMLLLSGLAAVLLSRPMFKLVLRRAIAEGTLPLI